MLTNHKGEKIGTANHVQTDDLDGDDIDVSNEETN